MYLERTLLCNENKEYTEEELLNSSKYIVVLAEPGGGKTELSGSIANKLNCKSITANRFANSINTPQNSPLVIDYTNITGSLQICNFTIY